MRINFSGIKKGWLALALALVAGSIALFSAERAANTGFSAHSKTYYADPATVNFVRPGLTITIKSATIAADGTISVNYTLTDPKAQPLDIAGLVTPGTVSISYLAAYIPSGQPSNANYFYSYTTRTQTSPITKVSAIQAGSDSGGTLQTVAMGEYIYTFKTKAVSNTGGAYDKNATHRIGLYGNRNLTEFDLGTNYASTTYDFVPSGAKVTVVRDIIRNGACNKCHDDLVFHGGSRKGMDLCIMCHQPQTVDPDTGNNVAADIFFHRLHMGENLPSVKAGKAYQIIGFNQGVSDYSTVAFPANGGPLACTACHDSSFGATQQNKYLTNPNREACGSCHDNVNFASGLNHVNLPQISDQLCANCHIPQGDLEFDASIIGAHTIATQSRNAPGINFTIKSVTNNTAGKAPLVTFTIKDNAGNPITMAQMTGGLNRMGIVLAGPTSDYGYTSFGSDQTTHGYISENPVPTAKCDSTGTCTYQFTHSIPANATGTYLIGLEGRRGLSINPGTNAQVDTEYGAKNVVVNFSVDGSPLVSRRTVVSINNCNKCHMKLSLHGENRNQIEQCVLCHNPSESDINRRPTAVVAADKTAPAQGVNFAYMIHRIHTGEELKATGATYTVVGFGGSHNDFTEVRYPVMTATGAVANTRKCYMCHVSGSESVLPTGKNAVTNPSALVSPAGPITSACTACHTTGTAMGHALSQTDPKFGESCEVCHATGADFSATKVHAN